MTATSAHYENYRGLIVRLKEVITTSQLRATDDSPDPLIIENLNFFTKAYLISLCTYLEAFLQDVAADHVDLVQSRIATAKIPHNLACWGLQKEVKDKDLKFAYLRLPITRKELSNELSGNPGKTITLFRYIGIDLRSSSQFIDLKEIVGNIVSKRNNIIHHNDNATDISMSDLLNYADQFLLYMHAIDVATSHDYDFG